MRHELKKLDGQRDLFSAKFVREGIKSAYRGALLPTILLKEVRRVSDQRLMCDHIWLNKTKALEAIELKVGLEIQFCARVKQYTKGYLGKKRDINREIKQDFKLSHPTQIRAMLSPHKGKEIAESKLIIRKARRIE